jgi:hypothetical protein
MNARLLSAITLFQRCCPSAALAFLMAVPIAGLAASTSVAQILSSPSTYDGSHVVVSGTVSGLVQKTSHKGNPYVTFSLCSNQCIHVFAFGSPSISDGQRITVHGTFEAVKRVGGYTFYNEIDADDGSP